MRQINQKPDNLLNKEVEISVRLGDLATLYALIANYETAEIQKCIRDSSAVPNSLISKIEKDKEFSDYKLYKALGKILEDNGVNEIQ